MKKPQLPLSRDQSTRDIFNGKNSPLQSHLPKLRLYFDREYFLQRANGVLRISADPLKQYFTDPALYHISPHPLFDARFYLDRHSDVKGAGMNPVEHYVLFGWRERRRFHPLFDIDQYLTQVKGVDSSTVDPLEHYLASGWKDGNNPCWLFDSVLYTRTNSDVDFSTVPPLVHYLTRGYLESRNPHPAFDVNSYFKAHPELNPKADEPLSHFIAGPEEKRRGIHPFFDPEWYVASNKDIREQKLSPELHYIRHGMVAGRPPNRFQSQKYIYSQFPEESFTSVSPFQRYLENRLDKRTRLLFLCHRANRTGAPLILLKIVQHLFKFKNLECFVILEQGGTLMADFEQVSHVYQLNDYERPIQSNEGVINDATREVFRKLFRVFFTNPPVAVFANSLETAHLGELCYEHGLRVFTLVHELALQFSEEMVQRLADHSEALIFPSEAARVSAQRRCRLNSANISIIPQGLLDPEFGKLPAREARKTVLDHLGLPENSRIVLGCGIVNWRKGPDYFIDVANRIIQDPSLPDNVHFVWVGEQWHTADNAKFWTGITSTLLDLGDRVHFVGPHDDSEPWFVAADAFLLTSRLASLPPVVHEAMASGTPVIAFDTAGGAPEALAEDSGIVTPYCDSYLMAVALKKLLLDDKLHSRIAKNAMVRVQQKYRFKDYVNKLLDHVTKNTDIPRERFGHYLSTTSGSKKVIISNPNWDISGVNTFSEILVEQLNKRGFNTEIVFTRGRFTNSQNEKESLLPKVPYRFLQPTQMHPLSVWSAVISDLKANAPCIYIPNYDYMASAVCPKLPPTVGVVGIAHSDDPEHYEHAYRLGTYWNRIVTITPYIAERLVALNPSFQSKIRIIPYGVAVGDEPEKLRKPLPDRAPSGPIEIVYSGRFVSVQKRILNYVVLAQRLIRRGIDFRMTLIGDGPMFSEVRRRLDSLISTERVVLTGRIGYDETIRRYELADVFLLLSDFEGLPLALLEAMERGCVPIATRIDSGIPDLIRDGENGLLIDKRDVDGAVEAVAALAADRARLATVARAARKAILDGPYTDKAMAKSYASLFDEVFEEIASGRYERSDMPFEHRFLPSPLVPRLEPISKLRKCDVDVS